MGRFSHATLVYVILIAIGVCVAWSLSGYDPGLTGDNKIKDYIRRILRILATAFLVAVLFGLHPARMLEGCGFIPALFIVPFPSP